MNNQPSFTLNAHDFQALGQAVEAFWPTYTHLPKDMTVYDYQNSLLRNNNHPKASERQPEVRNVIQNYVTQFFGETTAQEVSNQLKTNHSIATAQHATPISSIFTLAATLQTNLLHTKTSENNKYILVLSCAGVSLANPWNSRSYTFQTIQENVITEQQLPFFGRIMDSIPVMYAPGYTKESLKHMQKRVRHFQSERILKKKEYKKIEQLLTVLFNDEVLKHDNYMDQLTIQNYHVWKSIFANQTQQPSDVIFLSQEKIALELIEKYHLHQESIIHEILFNAKYHELILKYFNNILCAFSLEKKYGTFLFWGMSADGATRIQLFPQNDHLVSPDGSFSIALTPQAIKDGIENHRLMPSVLLTFMVLSFYYGYYLSGGMRQPWYLSEAKQAYLQMLKDLGQDSEAEYVAGNIPNDFVMSRAAINLVTSANQTRVPASGLDVLLYSNPHAWEQIIEVTKHLTMEEYLWRAYPEMYRVFCPPEQKKSELLQISEDAIEKFTGLDKKIPAWGTIA